MSRAKGVSQNMFNSLRMLGYTLKDEETYFQASWDYLEYSRVCFEQVSEELKKINSKKAQQLNRELKKAFEKCYNELNAKLKYFSEKSKENKLKIKEALLSFHHYN
jgi:predicted transcriptional regulator